MPQSSILQPHLPVSASQLPACRKGKRSALMDHQMKNKEHKQLVAEMEAGLKRVMLVGGVAHRLAGKVAVITGKLSSKLGWSSVGCPPPSKSCSVRMQLGIESCSTAPNLTA